MRIRLNLALIVRVVLEFFWLPWAKFSRRHHISLMKEQFSRLAKSAASNIFLYFVSFWATLVKDCFGLEMERLDIASFVFGSNKSLASQSRF